MKLARLAVDRSGQGIQFYFRSLGRQGDVLRRRMVWFDSHFRDQLDDSMSRFWGGKRGHRETSWETTEDCRQE